MNVQVGIGVCISNFIIGPRCVGVDYCSVFVRNEWATNQSNWFEVPMKIWQEIRTKNSRTEIGEYKCNKLYLLNCTFFADKNANLLIERGWPKPFTQYRVYAYNDGAESPKKIVA